MDPRLGIPKCKTQTGNGFWSTVLDNNELRIFMKSLAWNAFVQWPNVDAAVSAIASPCTQTIHTNNCACRCVSCNIRLAFVFVCRTFARLFFQSLSTNVSFFFVKSSLKMQLLSFASKFCKTYDSDENRPKLRSVQRSLVRLMQSDSLQSTHVNGAGGPVAIARTMIAHATALIAVLLTYNAPETVLPDVRSHFFSCSLFFFGFKTPKAIHSLNIFLFFLQDLDWFHH
jgi:hypothetical protein